MTYFISGLGADHRVFQFIQLPPEYEAVHLSWIKPHKNETLRNYALRLAQPIDRSQPIVLVGLSMGGMIATEIALALGVEKIVLISSIPLSSHLPWYYRAAGRLQLHRLLRGSIVKAAARLKLSTTKANSSTKKMLLDMIADTDPYFINWALKAILSWENEMLPPQLLHLHGTRDMVLPLRYTQPSHIIPAGTHTMVLTKAPTINRLLTEILHH